jgi:hypothetical protein
MFSGVVWRLQWGEVNRWEFLMLLIAGSLDLESVGQRIVELMELAVREHLEGVGRSQAERLMNMVEEESYEGWREE